MYLIGKSTIGDFWRAYRRRQSVENDATNAREIAHLETLDAMVTIGESVKEIDGIDTDIVAEIEAKTERIETRIGTLNDARGTAEYVTLTAYSLKFESDVDASTAMAMMPVKIRVLVQKRLDGVKLETSERKALYDYIRTPSADAIRMVLAS